jgi:hypothetical protein
VTVEESQYAKYKPVRTIRIGLIVVYAFMVLNSCALSVGSYPFNYSELNETLLKNGLGSLQKENGTPPTNRFLAAGLSLEGGNRSYVGSLNFQTSLIEFTKNPNLDYTSSLGAVWGHYRWGPIFNFGNLLKASTTMGLGYGKSTLSVEKSKSLLEGSNIRPSGINPEMPKEDRAADFEYKFPYVISQIDLYPAPCSPFLFGFHGGYMGSPPGGTWRGRGDFLIRDLPIVRPEGLFYSVSLKFANTCSK